MLKNIEKLQSERQENLSSLHEQKLQVENEISDLRVKIDDHLDKMQSQIINDLHENERREHERITSVLQSLSVQSLEVNQLKENIAAVKEHASDLQAFLLLEEIESRSNETCKKLIDMTESGDFDYSKLKHQEQKATGFSDSAFVYFGKIVTELSPTTIKLMARKEKQAQLPVDVLTSYSIKSLSVKLNRTINTGCQTTRGCVILPSGKSFFTCYYNDSIACFNKMGKRQFTKFLTPSCAVDISYSEDMNKIFISSGGS